MATKRQLARVELAEGRLSEKERRFVDYYMGKFAGNASRAAFAAGYGRTLKSAGQLGYRLLKKVQIRDAIDAKVAASPEVASVQQAQEYFSAVMLGRGRYADAKLTDRNKAGELLVRTQGGFTDKHVIGASGDLLELLSSIPLERGKDTE